MANKWLMHVKKTMKQMKSRGTYKKGDGLKKVILEAKKSYKKHKKGGAGSDGSASDTPAPAAADAPKVESKPEEPVNAPAGGRKRGTRRTRRHRK
jgi:hypothetical protein